MSRIAILALVFGVGQVTRPVAGVGFRVIPLQQPGGRPGQLHVWYPAEACQTPMKYLDYLALPGGPPRDLSREMRTALESDGFRITDDGWQQVITTPMTACRDARASSGRPAVILALHLPGAWPITAERFARAGYVFASVERAPGRPAAGDLPARIAGRMIEQIDDLATAVDALNASALADVSRIGLLGQSHVLLMFAMRDARVRAVALQDSGFQTGAEADAETLTGSWRAGNFAVPLLHAIPEARLASEALWKSFVTASPTRWTRLVMRAPSSSHSDVTTDGYLARTRLPGITDKSRLAETFLALVEIQIAFMNEHVTGMRGRAAIDPSLFRVERR